MKESDIQKMIVDHLTTIIPVLNVPFFFFSIPNESFLMAAKIAGMDSKTISILMTHLKKMGMIPGVPDLCVLCEGRTIFFEIKRPGEKLTKNQKRIHDIIEKTGHRIFIVDGLAGFRHEMNLMGVYL